MNTTLSGFWTVFTLTQYVDMGLPVKLPRINTDSGKGCHGAVRLKSATIAFDFIILFLMLSGFCPVHADEFIYSGDKLRDSLSVRNQQSPARFPRPICRATLYDVTAGTTLVVNAWSNATNDTRIDNVGYSCELHLCDPFCEYADSKTRFDYLGGVAQNGGSNITRAMHHSDNSRYGRITLRDYRQSVSVELQCRAYNKQGKGERLTVDGCGIDVQEVR